MEKRCQPRNGSVDLNPGALSADGGAYLLYFSVREPVVLPILRLNNPSLDCGTYVYAGSAYGPGGIRARVSRHLRIEKKPHWHVDYLSTCVACARVEVFPGGNECDLVLDLLRLGGDTPISAYGSTDCKFCEAHLVRLAG
ncbi:MAG: GIY-YIG nuclease family protein [Pseudomonadota bacterium]|nr:GIY-YIG nuclease family protein [Pseudomonadota bacterium]